MIVSSVSVLGQPKSSPKEVLNPNICARQVLMRSSGGYLPLPTRGMLGSRQAKSQMMRLGLMGQHAPLSRGSLHVRVHQPVGRVGQEDHLVGGKDQEPLDV